MATGNKETGAGSGKIVVDGRPVIVIAVVVNFDIESAVLKPGHTAFIDAKILPLLRSWTVTRARLTGLASRTGSSAYDLGLGQRRAQSVQSYLFSKLSGTFKSIDTGIDTASEGHTHALGKSDVVGANDRAVRIEIFFAFAGLMANPGFSVPDPDAPKFRSVSPPPPPPYDPNEPDKNIIAEIRRADTAYIKKGSAGDDIRMFLVIGGSKTITEDGDNRLRFEAGDIVDCKVSAVGVHLTISEGVSEQDKRTVVPSMVGTTEEYLKLNERPVPWSFNFTFSGIESGSVSSIANVICYSNWIKGMADPFGGKGTPRPRTP